MCVWFREGRALAPSIGQLPLKVGYVIFQKRFRKLSGGRVPKQTCSQSAVRGVSTHDTEESVQWTAEPSDRKIEMVDKKLKRKTSAER